MCASLLPADSWNSLLCAFDLRDDFLADGLRRGLVMVELHGVGGAPLGLRPQVGRVAEHLRERHVRSDHLRVPPGVDPLDSPPPGAQVPDDVPREILGADDLDPHDRLEQDGPGALACRLERHRPRDLEGHLRGVDLVIRTLDQAYRDVDHGISGDDAPLGRLHDPLLDGRHIHPRNRAADDLVDELEPLPLLRRLDGDPDVTVLAATAGLADVASFLLHLARDRLAVGDLGPPDVRLDLELAQQAVDDDLEVELAHPGNDGLPRLIVVPDLDGG